MTNQSGVTKPKKLYKDLNVKKPLKVTERAAMYQAVIDAKGLLTIAAERVGIDYTTHLIWMREPEYNKKIKEAVYIGKEKRGDHAESQLQKNIDEGKETSLIFYLKKFHKDRGYGDEIGGSVDYKLPLIKIVDDLDIAYTRIYDLLNEQKITITEATALTGLIETKRKIFEAEMLKSIQEQTLATAEELERTKNGK